MISRVHADAAINFDGECLLRRQSIPPPLRNAYTVLNILKIQHLSSLMEMQCRNTVALLFLALQIL